jgi:hypothetical protein
MMEPIGRWGHLNRCITFLFRSSEPAIFPNGCGLVSFWAASVEGCVGHELAPSNRRLLLDLADSAIDRTADLARLDDVIPRIDRRCSGRLNRIPRRLGALCDRNAIGGADLESITREFARD